jgi:hypothetical protein
MNANPKYPQIIEVKEELALPKVAKKRKLPNPAEEQALGQ